MSQSYMFVVQIPCEVRVRVDANDMDEATARGRAVAHHAWNNLDVQRRDWAPDWHVAVLVQKGNARLDEAYEADGLQDSWHANELKALWEGRRPGSVPVASLGVVLEKGDDEGYIHRYSAGWYYREPGLRSETHARGPFVEYQDAFNVLYGVDRHG